MGEHQVLSGGDSISFQGREGMEDSTDKGRTCSMNKNIAEEIEKKAVDNKLPCPVAGKIAQDPAVTYKEVGGTADELKMKIAHCEPGCF
jgi:hypothetical protein